MPFATRIRHKAGAMTNAILAELSSDSFATVPGITARSPSLVLALCRKLIESGTYGSSIPLDAYRGATLCLRVHAGSASWAIVTSCADRPLG